MITPQTRQRLITEVAQKYVDRTLGSIKYALDHGWLLWQMKKPAERLLGYQRSTNPADLQYVLNPDYLNLLKAGILPPLKAMQAYEMALQPQPATDPATGQPALDKQTGQPQMMPPPPLQQTEPYFWGMLAPPRLPDMVFLRFQRDFIHLVDDNLKGNANFLPQNLALPGQS